MQLAAANAPVVDKKVAKSNLVHQNHSQGREWWEEQVGCGRPTLWEAI